MNTYASTPSTARKVVLAVPAGDRCGEGAVWHAGHNSLYWTDICRFLIHAYHLPSKTTRHWFFDEPVVAITLTSQDDTLLVALGSRVIFWQPHTDKRRDQGFYLKGWPKVRLNDGRADPLGNFWVGSMRNNVNTDGSPGEAGGEDGMLYRITPQGDVSVWREKLGIANTLCWSPDGTKFYFADTLANAVRMYSYESHDASIGNEQPWFVDFAKGVPDGSSVDSDGVLWNCRYGGGCLLRIDPNGQLLEEIRLPFSNPTTCAFGGEDLRTLFITSADGGPTQPQSGGLFSMKVKTPGLPATRFLLT